jgi:hypothetical protein
MRYKRLLFQIVLALSISLIISLLFFTIAASGELQQSQRTVQLTLLPDYANNQVMVLGIIFSTTAISVEEAQSGDWGFEGDLNIWTSEPGGVSRNFYVQGVLPNAFLRAPEETGAYKIVIGPLQIPPGDTLALTIPFASLVSDNLSPAPGNLDEIKKSDFPLPFIRYSASEDPLELTIEIPFFPINKEIDLNLLPLVGELIQNRQDSYRLFGQVTFKAIRDFATFQKYCQPTIENPFWPYRMADTLFTLDYLPIFHFGYLPPAYQYKPSYLLVRSELRSCSYEGEAGQVVTSFTGRVFHQPQDGLLFPDFLLDQDVPERQVEVQDAHTGNGIGIYEIQLGSIFLGPGDRLKVNLPEADMRSISPAPSRFSYTETGQILAEFDGPEKFVLKVSYAPRPELFVQQFPVTLRAIGSKAENFLLSLNTGPVNWQPWAVFVACLATLAGVQRFGRQLKLWQRVSVWFIAGALCYYSFPHIFGLIFFAIGVHLLATWKTRSQDAIIRTILTLLAAIVFLALDTKARDLIFMLDGYHLELTMFTPALLMVFGLITYLIYRHPKEKSKWMPREIVGPAMFLFALSVLDALQKSLPAILLAGGLIFMIFWRYNESPSKQGIDYIPNIPDRLHAAWRSPFLWIGLFTLSIFVISNDVTSTAEVLAPSLGVIRFLLSPLLLFLSVVLSFLSTGGLFLLLYPSLPFREGYLKAIVFTLGLLVIFIFGVGGDDRFVTALPVMLVGRFIYYLSAPLLIGIFMEVYIAEETRKASQGTEKTAEKKEVTGYAFNQMSDPLKRFLGPLGSLISLVAPALFAWVSNQPLITSYYDVLEILIQFTLS